MDKIIGVTELQRKFRSVFDEVVHKHVPYIITRGNRPEAVLIPYAGLFHFQAGAIRSRLRASSGWAA